MDRKLIFILAVVLCANGCAMIPKYRRPKSPVPESWPVGSAYPKADVLSGKGDVSRIKWQEFFTDPKLQEVIRLAIDNNRDLRISLLNVDRARGLYGIQRSELLPVIEAGSDFTKQRYSSDFPGTSKITKKYTVDLGITSWEVDFFGRVRSLKKKALEEYLETEEAHWNAKISLISEVARAYLVVAADKERLDLASTTLESQKEAYDLIQRKYTANIANEADLCRARTQMDTAYADVMRYTQQVAQDKNALDLLAGLRVPDDLLPSGLSGIQPFPDIFPGLSSEVLLKRPDIMAAEHKLKAAYANIGAARAAFFPSISLTTALGSASKTFSDLLTSGRGTWVFAPQAAMPIFDMRIWAAYRVSAADRKIALAEYELAIQSAFREMADVLAVRGTVDYQIFGQQSVVDSAQKVYDITSKRYDNGLDSYLSVLDAQRSLYSARQDLIFLKLSKIANEVKAYAALGGGIWEDKPDASAEKKAEKKKSAKKVSAPAEKTPQAKPAS